MFSFATWHLNHQSSSVLMIDDLSDAYIDLYPEPYKNDWGYLCNDKNSAYHFLESALLNKFPAIKVSFFVPYARHNVINDNSEHYYQKFAIGERDIFSNFLKELTKKGHEIAHHGSNHGEYQDKKNLLTVNNFKHEWELFQTVEEGVRVTKEGIARFKQHADIDVVGGKFCGYMKKENSLEIIDYCNFLYWCDEVDFNHKHQKYQTFGDNKVISFPTNFAGNAFVRLSYKTGDKKRDSRKRVLKFFQPLYNLLSYKKLHNLYKKGGIISIQEHISPSTTSGNIQSANIVSDIKSLNKLYHYLSKKSIWYANCKEISTYLYVKKNSTLIHNDDRLVIHFNNDKALKNTFISIKSEHFFIISDETQTYTSIKNNHAYVVSLALHHGENHFKILKGLNDE